MSEFIVAVFSSDPVANEASEKLKHEGYDLKIVILNEVPEFTTTDPSYKLDGIISGVSDVFIGLPAFVNPMSMVGLPPQENTEALTNNEWPQLGIDETAAKRYQEMITEGRTIVSYESEDNHSLLLDKLKQYGAIDTTIHSF